MVKQALAFAAALFPLPILGATFVVPPDSELVQRADSIVLGTVVSVWPRLDANGLIETVTDLAVEETIKGSAGSGVVRIVHWGGVVGDRWLIATGTPEYTPGQRSLVFLHHNQKGEWTTLDLALGRFDLGFDTQGRELLVRDREAIAGWDRAGAEHREHLRLARPFLEFVRARANGFPWPDDYWAPADSVTMMQPPSASADVIATAFTGTQYCLLLGGQPARRAITSVGWRLAGNQTGLDSDAAVTKGTSSWTSDAGSNVTYSKSGTPAAASIKDPFDGEDRVIANDPGNDISGTFTGSGTVAVAFIGGTGGSHTFGGESFTTISGADIVIQDGVGSAFGQERFNTVMTHELGHTLGFRHSNRTANDQNACADPLPCSGSAIMNSSVISGLNGNLQAWDRDGVRTLFGSGPACTSPAITTHPQSQTIESGSSASLSVSVTGTTPSFQWFRGAKPDTSNPVGTNASSFNTGTLTATTTFWVRVSNSCGTVDSNDATITVTTACPNPAITSQPQSATITSGQSRTLTVSATSATAITFQWFRGVRPDTSNPVGGNAASFETGPLTSSTSFWVRLTNACGSTDSQTATVTVCTPPSITAQPANQTITAGQTATLSATASGTAPRTLTWFQGLSGNTSTPVGSGSQFVTPILTATTSFWVRVQNNCGAINSSTATITVVPQCTPPQITAEPSDASIAAGASALLSVVATGTGLTYAWFEGAAGDTSRPVGDNSAFFDTGPLNASTSYWARVSNACGQENSRTVVVNVGPACQPASITAPPQPATVASGRQAFLSLGVAGTSPLTFQWFEGATGDTTRPLGPNSSFLATPSLTSSTSFWVRVVNACGSADSDAASVTVVSVRPRAIRR